MGLGLNEGGAGAARFFLRAGARVTITDVKKRSELTPTVRSLDRYKKKYGIRQKIRYVLGKHRMKDFENSDLIIQGPGVPYSSLFLRRARKRGIAVTTDIGIFFEHCPAPVIGITGSKGKSTTSALLGSMLKQTFRDVVVAGNIGVSPLDFIPPPEIHGCKLVDERQTVAKRTDKYRGYKSVAGGFIGTIRQKTRVVLELSSWQVEGMARHGMAPHIAAITNIFPEHLNRYGSFRAYAMAKALIFKHQKRGDVLVVGRQTAVTIKKELQRALSRVVVAERWQKSAYDSVGCLAGSHNAENIEIARTIARICGVSEAGIRKGMRLFRGLSGRQEKIAEIAGISYYNDTTATMPDAAIAALRTIRPRPGGKLILIAGGTDKKLDFSAFAHEIARNAETLILLKGDATAKIRRELFRIGFLKSHPLAHVDFTSMKQAVRAARSRARSGDIVLLSPGAASFGMFQNEFDRGMQFIREVKK